MVEHVRQHRGRVALRHSLEPLDRFGQSDCPIVQVYRLAFRCGPQQRHRLGHVADIVAAHPQQHRVDPFFRQCANHRRLHRWNVERAGQRRQRQPAIGIGRAFEILADQPQLA